MDSLTGCGFLIVERSDPIHKLYKSIFGDRYKLVGLWYTTTGGQNHKSNDIIFMNPYMGQIYNTYTNQNITIENIIKDPLNEDIKIYKLNDSNLETKFRLNILKYFSIFKALTPLEIIKEIFNHNIINSINSTYYIELFFNELNIDQLFTIESTNVCDSPKLSNPHFTEIKFKLEHHGTNELQIQNNLNSYKKQLTDLIDSFITLFLHDVKFFNLILNIFKTQHVQNYQKYLNLSSLVDDLFVLLENDSIHINMLRNVYKNYINLTSVPSHTPFAIKGGLHYIDRDDDNLNSYKKYIKLLGDELNNIRTQVVSSDVNIIINLNKLINLYNNLNPDVKIDIIDRKESHTAFIIINNANDLSLKIISPQNKKIFISSHHPNLAEYDHNTLSMILSYLDRISDDEPTIQNLMNTIIKHMADKK